MARETKLGLLVGLGVILLIGIIVSDHLSAVNKDGADMTVFAQQVGDGIAGGPVQTHPDPAPDALALTPGTGGGTGAVALMHPGGVSPSQPNVIQHPRPEMGPGITIPGSTVAPAADVPSVVINTPNINTPASTEPKPLATHTVVRGDSAYQIARRYYKDGEKWRLILEANPGHMGKNGELQVGTQLRIPAVDAPAPVASPANTTPIGSIVDSTPSRTATDNNSTSATRVVTVEAGQNLTEIAREHLNNGSRWPEILQANRDQLARPEDLKVGMKLRVPADAPRAGESAPVGYAPAQQTAAKRTYTVQAGDNLFKIAGKTLGDGKKWPVVLAANRDRLNSEHDIKIGQQLVIPAMASR